MDSTTKTVFDRVRFGNSVKVDHGWYNPPTEEVLYLILVWLARQGTGTSLMQHFRNQDIYFLLQYGKG